MTRPSTRADVYALGLLLYQLLTGRPPFGDGTPTEIAMRRLGDRLPRPSEHRSGIPPALDDDVAHLLDGDASTAWRTHGYYGDPALGGLKSGVGVWLDLGESHNVSEVTVATTPPGGSFTLFAGDAPPPNGAAPGQWGEEAATVDNTTGTTRVELDDVTDVQFETS